MKNRWKGANANATESQRELLTWYLDQYVAMSAGNDYWGEKQKLYNRLIDSAPIGLKEEAKVLVTITSEGFGLFLFENGREKWKNTFEYKKANGKKAKIPMGKQEGADKYRGKYSETNDGQVKSTNGGGLKKEAIAALNSHIREVRSFREEDKSKGWQKHSIGKKLIREKHGIEEDSPPSKRRRRNKKKPVNVTPEKEAEIMVIDE